MVWGAKKAAAEPPADDRPSDEGGASSERAVLCPRCGGEFQPRAIRGNPFLSKAGAFVACVDCGLDCNAVAVYRLADPW